jgi:hypothetical protein
VDVVVRDTEGFDHVNYFVYEIYNSIFLLQFVYRHSYIHKNMSIEESIPTFLNNPWVLLIIAVGAFLVFIDPISRGYRFSKRPKIEFETHLESDEIIEHDEKVEKITFWIFVSNKGRALASQCKVQIKITDKTGTLDVGEKMDSPYKEGTFPIKWNISNEQKNSINIFSKSKDYGKFKLPFEVTIPKEEHEENTIINYPHVSVNYTDPIKKMNFPNPYILEEIGEAIGYSLLIHVYVNTLEKNFEKQFKIIFPINAETMKKDYIIFEEKNKVKKYLESYSKT